MHGEEIMGRMARTRRIVLSAIWAAGALGAGTVSAAGGLLWQDQLDAAGASDRAGAIVASGRFTFAVGSVTGAAGNGDGLLRAYDAGTGALVWEDVLELGGDDVFVSVAAAGKAVFACGLGLSGTESNAFVVRAYDARTGAIVWEDRSALGGALDIKADRDVLIAGGFGTEAGGSVLSLMRAYELRTGALLWETAIPDGGFASSIATQGGRVFAAGGGNVEADGRMHFLVRAYSERTGALLWERQDDRAGLLDFASSVRAKDGRVYVAGAVSHVDGACTFDFFTGNCDFLLRAYDAATGALLWEDQVDKTGHRDQAYSVVLQGDRVFAGGFGSTDFTRNFLVRAYDAATGTLLWEDHQSDRGGGVNSLAALGDTIYAGGDGASPVTGSSLDFLVRAYDASTGGLVWEDKYDQAEGADTVLGLAARRGRVFAAGWVENEAGDTDYLVRAYEGE